MIRILKQAILLSLSVVVLTSPVQADENDELALLSAAPYPERFALNPTTVKEYDQASLEQATAATVKPTTPLHADYRFSDQSSLAGRLKDIRDLRLLTFWGNDAAVIYLGVGPDGLAGINISQRALPERAAYRRRRRVGVD